MAEEREVKEYFKAKAGYYDEVDSQSYWVFSDTLLWNLLKKLIIPSINKTTHLLDAGGGTARWSIKIAKETGCKAIVYDFSQEMLKVAREKIQKLGLTDKIRIIEGNLNNIKEIEKKSQDVIICFHNVISFVKSPLGTMKQIAKLMKKNSIIILMAPNKYHSLYFNIYRGAFNQLDMNVKENKVQFTDNVPKMHTFTPESLKKLLTNSGIKPIKIIGFPITIYPGIEETKIHGESEKLKNIFSNKETFNKLLKIEEEACMNEDAAGRGNNLLIIGRKL